MEQIDITNEETKIANEEGAYLYGYLRKKYSNESTSHLDILLNSLSFALLRMIHLHVRKKDREMMVKVVNEILLQGIKQD